MAVRARSPQPWYGRSLELKRLLLFVAGLVIAVMLVVLFVPGVQDSDRKVRLVLARQTGGLMDAGPFLAAATVAAFLAAASPLVAQTLDRAEITGTIRDETGAALGGVSVTLRETKTGFERTMVTGDDGRYSAPLMPLGVYVVQAERPGFSAATSEPLTLTVGQALVVNVVMRVAGLTETVSIVCAGRHGAGAGHGVRRRRALEPAHQRA